MNKFFITLILDVRRQTEKATRKRRIVFFHSHMKAQYTILAPMLGKRIKQSFGAQLKSTPMEIIK